MPAKRLLSDIVSLTPSNYEDLTRCPRLFYCNALLGLPASDPAPSTVQGLVVHDMLRKIHLDGNCFDADHVADVLVAHGMDTPAVREMVARHADRCPSRASERAAHEVDVARFHRLPPPMFMATARIDAVWVHDGMIDARDYKTGGKWVDRVCEIKAAHVQAYVLAERARRKDSACGCATSTCSRRSTRIRSRGTSTTRRWTRSEKSCAPRCNACGPKRNGAAFPRSRPAAPAGTGRSVVTARRRANPRGRC